MPNLHVAPHAAFSAILDRAPSRAPQAFGDGALRNLYDGSRHDVGEPVMMITPVDGTATIALPQVDAATAQSAVAAAADAHRDWWTT